MRHPFGNSFAISRGSVVTILGVTQVSQAVESAGAMKFRLSGDELARLDERPARAVR